MIEKSISGVKHTVLTQRVTARLALHLHLDRILWLSLRAYMGQHKHNRFYWEQQCQPYIDLLPEHSRFAQLSTHRLRHYTDHVTKVTQHAPQGRPAKKQVMAFLSLVEMWYWREYP